MYHASTSACSVLPARGCFRRLQVDFIDECSASRVKPEANVKTIDMSRYMEW